MTPLSRWRAVKAKDQRVIFDTFTSLAKHWESYKPTLGEKYRAAAALLRSLARKPKARK